MMGCFVTGAVNFEHMQILSETPKQMHACTHVCTCLFVCSFVRWCSSVFVDLPRLLDFLAPRLLIIDGLLGKLKRCRTVHAGGNKDEDGDGGADERGGQRDSAAV